MTNLFAIVAVLGVSSLVAHAGDAQKLDCVGNAGSRGQRAAGVRLSITYTDVRASDGSSRVQAVSAIHNKKVYQGSYLSSSGDFPVDAPVVLKDLKNPRNTFFSGAMTLTPSGSGPDDDYRLRLSGDLFELPDTNDSYVIDATLLCVDRSI